jgi:hypothetical protein
MLHYFFFNDNAGLVMQGGSKLEASPGKKVSETLSQKTSWAGHHWLTSIILAIQEAEIRKIKV